NVGLLFGKLIDELGDRDRTVSLESVFCHKTARPNCPQKFASSVTILALSVYEDFSNHFGFPQKHISTHLRPSACICGCFLSPLNRYGIVTYGPTMKMFTFLQIAY